MAASITKLLLGARVVVTKRISWSSDKWGSGYVPKGKRGMIKRISSGTQVVVAFGAKYGLVGCYADELRLT